MDLHPGHFVAIIGGAVSGSEAAARLSDRGIYSVVFEQGPRPYGKIEDGLPKWHTKLQLQEEKKIDEKLTQPRVFFVPNTRLGDGLDFHDLVHNWGFSAILLANGAWKDRALPIAGADAFVGKGLLYQNPLVMWFNHYHDSNYDGPHYDLPDDAIIVGGGLASLDVAKILMLETVLKALRQRDIHTDVLTLEHKTIGAFLEERGLTLSDLGLKGCTLYYRRRIRDMPLAPIPPDATPKRREKVYQGREKILGNFQKKYLFRFEELRTPTGLLVEGEHLVGLKFSETEIKDGRPVTKPGSEYEVRSPLVVSSIGSIPEPIPGIDMTDELYKIRDRETGQLTQYDNVFALGNVVTGKGNIKASLDHGRQVSDHVVESFLAWREEDYKFLLDRGMQNARERVDKITEILNQKNVLSVEEIQSILARIKTLHKRVNYDGDYHRWIQQHAVEKLQDILDAKKQSG